MQLDNGRNIRKANPLHDDLNSAIFGYHARPGVIRTFMRREGLPAFIRSTICPEANSNVKCEMKMFGTAATRSKSELSLTGGVPLPSFFPVVSADHHILGSAFACCLAFARRISS